jgi:Predicted spermidine synthase with an N-terminal membrane domain
VTRLARENPLFLELNGGSLLSPKVTVVNDDAMKWLETETGLFDLVFVDFPTRAASRSGSSTRGASTAS